jgi:site-specific DNA-methyltransferase (adenine-specific)
MPEAMAQDLIISWSKPGDLVFDPMCGAGTTCKMALLNNRRYLGMEVFDRYCEIARERVRLALEQIRDSLVRTFEQ